MAEKNEANWWQNYQALKAFVAEHQHLPNKKKIENRGLLNWWKYNKRQVKLNKLPIEKVNLLHELSEMRKVKQSSEDKWKGISRYSKLVVT